jgi:hypothetical protein
MQKNILGIVIVGVLVVGAGAYIVHLRTENEQLKLGGTKASAARGEASAPAARVLSAEQRQAMLEKLDSRGGTAHAVWFATVPNNPEAASFQKQIQGVFEEAGWTVAGNAPVTFSLKPGIFFFMAEEEPPDHIQSIAAAFDAAGIQITAGRGYRQFYQDKKKDNPNWNGFELKPDQDFILVIGRKPEEEKTAKEQ